MSDVGLWIAIFVAIAVGFMIYGYLQEKRRQEEMQAIADLLGYAYAKGPDSNLPSSLGHFHIFSQGRSRRARHILVRQIDDVTVTVFDYEYTTSSGRNSSTRKQTVALFESSRFQFPSFSLRPQGFTDQIAIKLGRQNIVLEDHPAFADAYLLQGQHVARIRALFRAPVVSFYNRSMGLSTEGMGRQLVHYRDREKVDAQHIDRFVREGQKALALLVEEEDPLAGIDLDAALAVLEHRN
jgi:hypothetical protein